MSKKARRGNDRLSRLLRLYASLPTIRCKGLCTQACGPIIGSRLERERLTKTGGKAPGVDESLTCVYLKDGRCSAYEVRPTVCRIWGLVKDEMECEHGCEPSRWLSDDEGKRLLREAQAIGGEDPEWYRATAAVVRQAMTTQGRKR